MVNRPALGKSHLRLFLNESPPRRGELDRRRPISQRTLPVARRAGPLMGGRESRPSEWWWANRWGEAASAAIIAILCGAFGAAGAALLELTVWRLFR